MSTKVKPTITTQEMLVRRLYRYNGVNIIVEIDYLRKIASILRYNPESKELEPAEFVFANRQLEYMAGWQLILDAIKYAVEQATKDLDKSKKKDLQKIIDMHLHLGKLK